MTTSRWSLLGYFFGLVIMIASMIFAFIFFNHYFFNYRDMDKLVAYTAIGLLGFINGIYCCAFFWIHNELLNKENRLDAVEQKVTDHDNDIKLLKERKGK